MQLLLFIIITCNDAMTSEDHDGGQRGAEDGVLTKVEQRQAGGGLE